MDISKLRISNAAGMIKTVEDVRSLVNAPITDIVVGSITVEERTGNPEPTFWTAPDGAFSLNARGLPGPGVAYYEKHGEEMRKIAHDAGKQLTASIAATLSSTNWITLAVAAAKFADKIEVNISCPNKWSNGAREQVVAENPEAVQDIIMGLLNQVPDLPPLGLKLPPYMSALLKAEVRDDTLLLSMIKTIKDLGDIVSEVVSCNTLGGVPTYYGNTKVLSMEEGGLSGPQLREWSLRQVQFLRKNLPMSVKLTGVGGITHGFHIHDFLDAGADGVQVGTHFFNHTPRVFEELLAEM